MFIKFLRDENGATAIEYGLIVAVLSLTVIAGVESFGNSLQDMFLGVSNTLDEQTVN